MLKRRFRKEQLQIHLGNLSTWAEKNVKEDCFQLTFRALVFRLSQSELGITLTSVLISGLRTSRLNGGGAGGRVHFGTLIASHTPHYLHSDAHFSHMLILILRGRSSVSLTQVILG